MTCIDYWTDDPFPDADYTRDDIAWDSCKVVVAARLQESVSRHRPGYRAVGPSVITEQGGGMIHVRCNTAVSWRAP